MFTVFCRICIERGTILERSAKRAVGQLSSCFRWEHGDLWGVKGSLALYGASTMSGSGLLPYGETSLDRFAFWFRQAPGHAAFQRACGLLEAGINSFQAAKKLGDSLQDLRHTC